MIKMKRLFKQQKLQKCQDAIDSKFADIQRYILNIEFLDEKTKENMLSLCIMCNDALVKNMDLSDVESKT